MSKKERLEAAAAVIAQSNSPEGGTSSAETIPSVAIDDMLAAKARQEEPKAPPGPTDKDVKDFISALNTGTLEKTEPPAAALEPTKEPAKPEPAADDPYQGLPPDVRERLIAREQNARAALTQANERGRQTTIERQEFEELKAQSTGVLASIQALSNNLDGDTLKKVLSSVGGQNGHAPSLDLSDVTPSVKSLLAQQQSQLAEMQKRLEQRDIIDAYSIVEKECRARIQQDTLLKHLPLEVIEGVVQSAAQATASHFKHGMTMNNVGKYAQDAVDDQTALYAKVFKAAKQLEINGLGKKTETEKAGLVAAAGVRASTQKAPSLADEDVKRKLFYKNPKDLQGTRRASDMRKALVRDTLRSINQE